MITAKALLMVARSYLHQEIFLDAMVAGLRKELGADPIVLEIPVEKMVGQNDRYYGPHMLPGTEFVRPKTGARFVVLANFIEGGCRYFVYDRLPSAIAA